MKNIDIINANTDLGVAVDGACLGPDKITEGLTNPNLNNIYKLYADETNKEKDFDNKKKNLENINSFNEKLYKLVGNTIDDCKFPITIGGDHSMAIASALASISRNKSLGIIWIDAHGDFNTFDTTITGNIHGLPLAAITGYEKRDLVEFHNGNHYNYANTVIVGARDIDPMEKLNLEEAGVKVFTTQEVHDYGMESVMQSAINTACNGTNGVHISYDLDVIDPKLAPGVSVPAEGGITLEEAYEAVNVITRNKDKVKSLDLVEYNPLRDEDNVTKMIARNILRNFLNCLGQ